MKPFAKWALVGTAGVLIGAFLMNASGTFALSSSSGNGAAPSQSQATGDQIQLTPGQSASVACSGTKLSWTQTERKDGVATCTSRSTGTTSTTSTTSTTTGSNPPPTECPQFLTEPKASQAFCDTMGTPDPVANTRSGDLNGVVWGVSRITGNNTTSNLNVDPWANSIEDVCGTKSQVSNLNDINVCNGQMVEASDDSGSQTVLAMYPRQPFNFAGRTGLVEFNVSDNSESSHTAWPTFAITDQPIPDPDMSTQVGFDGNNPRNGIEIDFFGSGSSSPHCVYANVAAVSNYQQMNVPQTDSGCVLAAPNKEIVKTTLDQNGDNNGGASSGIGKMNHVEIAISSSGLQVYMSNAGTTNMQLVTTANFSVPLTQGLVWLEDQHYNGDKFSEDQQTNTFAWSDLAFDGPVEPRDLGFDVLDNTMAASNTAINGLPQTVIAYGQQPSCCWPASTTKVTVSTATGPTAQQIHAASGALLVLNTPGACSSTKLTYVVNGSSNTYNTATTRGQCTMALPIPLSEVVAGKNTFIFSEPNAQMGYANMDLILQGAGGVVPPT